jgi:hypothetical protein
MIISLPWSFCSMSISSCLITMIIVSCVSPPWSSFYVHTPSLCDLVATTPYHIHLHHVLLMPNSKHLTHGISNLVSLITKTKLRLSPWPPLTSMLCIGCSSWASGHLARWICHAFSSRPGPKNNPAGRAKAEGQAVALWGTAREAWHVVPAQWPSIVVVIAQMTTMAWPRMCNGRRVTVVGPLWVSNQASH